MMSDQRKRARTIILLKKKESFAAFKAGIAMHKHQKLIEKLEGDSNRIGESIQQLNTIKDNESIGELVCRHSNNLQAVTEWVDEINSIEENKVDVEKCLEIQKGKAVASKLRLRTLSAKLDDSNRAIDKNEIKKNMLNLMMEKSREM